MIILWFLAIVSGAVLVAAVRSVLHDGPARPPRSHSQDPAFLPPSQRAPYDSAA